SHELRTPLAAIKSVIETLQRGALAEPEAAADFLARADAEADRLVQMVEELLELSRIESGQVPLVRQPVDVSDVLARAVERMRAQAQLNDVGLTLEVSPGLPAITGDGERLERVVLNLLQNAIKFTPAGGSVHVSANREADTVTVRVHDTGEGIDADELPRVFERFYKGDRSRVGAGSGLGLAIVKHTVEAHGGTVGVSSDPGRGSTFTFTIPSSSVAIER
ncbi:MAG: ATP-binding protein, partial [Dehalococcoidia bacterium]